MGHGDGAADEGSERDRREGSVVPGAGEGLEIGDHVGDPPGAFVGLVDLRGGVGEPVGVPRGAVSQALDVGQHVGQRVVHLVGYPRRQGPHRRQAVVVPQHGVHALALAELARQLRLEIRADPLEPRAGAEDHEQQRQRDHGQRRRARDHPAHGVPPPAEADRDPRGLPPDGRNQGLDRGDGAGGIAGLSAIERATEIVDEGPLRWRKRDRKRIGDRPRIGDGRLEGRVGGAHRALEALQPDHPPHPLFHLAPLAAGGGQLPDRPRLEGDEDQGGQDEAHARRPRPDAHLPAGPGAVHCRLDPGSRTPGAWVGSPIRTAGRVRIENPSHGPRRSGHECREAGDGFGRFPVKQGRGGFRIGPIRTS